MSGDGLTDVVRIRNGEVCYWPNLGYGKLWAKVGDGHGADFDAPDLFDPRRIRMFDIDGSGTTDIVYLGREGVRFIDQPVRKPAWRGAIAAALASRLRPHDGRRGRPLGAGNRVPGVVLASTVGPAGATALHRPDER